MEFEIRIGTSGWTYAHWAGKFYPPDLKQNHWLSYYQQYFDTVEINSTFYASPRDQTFINWHAKAPENFLFVVKASRFITHFHRLQNTEESLVRFYDNVSLLKEKLGPVLFQLPPGLHADAVLLKNFLKLLPPQSRFVFEFRHASWFSDEIYRLLDSYNASFCIYELGGRMSPMMVTGNFAYLRLHGPGSRYRGSYTDKTLHSWADQCISWSKSKDVFVFFDNDEQAYAAYNAMRLKEIIAESGTDRAEL